MVLYFINTNQRANPTPSTAQFTVNTIGQEGPFRALISNDGSKAGGLGTNQVLYARELKNTNPVSIADFVGTSTFLSSYDGAVYYKTAPSSLASFTSPPVATLRDTILSGFGGSSAVEYGNPTQRFLSRTYIDRFDVQIGDKSPIQVETITAFSVSDATVALADYSNVLLVVCYQTPSQSSTQSTTTPIPPNLFPFSFRPSLVSISTDRYVLIETTSSNPGSDTPDAAIYRFDSKSSSISIEKTWTDLQGLADEQSLTSLSAYYRQAVWYDSLGLLAVLYLASSPSGLVWRVNFYMSGSSTPAYSPITVSGSPANQMYDDTDAITAYPPTTLSNIAPPRVIVVENKQTSSANIPVFVTTINFN